MLGVRNLIAPHPFNGGYSFFNRNGFGKPPPFYGRQIQPTGGVVQRENCTGRQPQELQMNTWDADPSNYQVGGTHYTDMQVQPWEVMEVILTDAEFIGYLRGNVIKYAMRQGKKDGSDDANKAKHYVEKLDETLRKVRARQR
jgi:hypothetical protein